jgi:hypothetical protein
LVLWALPYFSLGHFSVSACLLVVLSPQFWLPVLFFLFHTSEYSHSFAILTLLIHKNFSSAILPPKTLIGNIFLKTALLRYNSHTIQFTHLNCTSQWIFSIFTAMCNHHQSQFQNILITSKRNQPHPQIL